MRAEKVKTDLNCLRCGGIGRSVAAIRNEESVHCDFNDASSVKKGAQSKRAELFVEPVKPKMPSDDSLDFFMMLLIILVAVNGFVVYLLDSLVASYYISELLRFCIINFSFFGSMFLLLILSIRHTNSVLESPEYKACCEFFEKELQKYYVKMNLYNDMRYCETCNLIYENQHAIVEPANKHGYDNVMGKLDELCATGSSTSGFFVYPDQTGNEVND